MKHWPRYRIVSDRFLGFEVQVREAWWRCWGQCQGPGCKICNTFVTLDAARNWAKTKPKRRTFQDYVIEEIEE